jgi:hypothetical protein
VLDGVAEGVPLELGVIDGVCEELGGGNAVHLTSKPSRVTELSE